MNKQKQTKTNPKSKKANEQAKAKKTIQKQTTGKRKSENKIYICAPERHQTEKAKTTTTTTTTTTTRKNITPIKTAIKQVKQQNSEHMHKK